MSDIFKVRARDARVVFLTNEVHPHHRLPFLMALQERVGTLTVLTSTPVSAQPWLPTSLDVRALRSAAFTQKGMHPQGYLEEIKVSVPVDVLPQLARLSPDVIIAHDMGARTAQAAIFRRSRRDTRLIVLACISTSTYAELRPGLARRLMRRFILKRVDAAIANGRSGAACLETFGYRGPTMSYVPYATDTAEFAHVGPKLPGTGSLRLVYVGQLIPRKGLLEFIDHLMLWARRNTDRKITFRIVGKGQLRDQLEAAARKAPPNVAICLTGPARYGELKDIYREADLMVFPSLADEWGQVVTEAMSCRLPVLGSVYSQAVEEMVVEGETGWLFHPDQRDEAEAAIDRALGTTVAGLEEMGALARRRSMECSPDFLAGRMVDAIEKLK